jgi:hypothetical protein
MTNIIGLNAQTAIEWTILDVDNRKGALYLSCVNENITYVCGTTGQISKTIDGGKTWAALTTNVPLAELHVVKFVDENIGFVGGELDSTRNLRGIGGGLLLKTIDGGNTWEEITLPDSINLINGIFLVDKDTIYIQQYLSVAILKSIDGGATWDTALSISTGEVMNFYMVDSVAYAVEYGNQGLKIYQSLDYANTWKEVYQDSVNWLDYFDYSPNSDLVFFNKDTIFVYLCDSLLYTTDAFTTWIKEPYLNDPYLIYGAYCLWTKAKKFSNGNYCMIISRPNSTAVYYINGKYGEFSEDYVHVVDGCCDSIFYVLSLSGILYTNRHFEQDTNAIMEIEDSFSLFPNPVEDKLIIENKHLLIKQISLFDLQGRILFIENNIHNCSYEINLQKYVSGMYFFQIHTNKGISIKKIVKR